MKTNQSAHKVHPASIEFLTNASWEFTRTHLYNGYHFSVAETAVAKQHIRNYYRDILPQLFHKYAGTYMSYFCDRVMMAKRYVMRNPSRFIPNPSVWLNPDNKNGFAGTKAWHQKQLAEMHKGTFMICFFN